MELSTKEYIIMYLFVDSFFISTVNFDIHISISMYYNKIKNTVFCVKVGMLLAI